MEEKYKSLHTICAVDWNGGTLFFQWILTLANYINEKYKSAFIIILLGPDSDFKKFSNIQYPNNLKLLNYSNISISEIVDLTPSDCLKNEEIYIYFHGWDKFSRIFIQKHGNSISSLFTKLNVYSDASKPIINLKNMDYFNWNDGIEFKELNTLAFTKIDNQDELNYLLKENKFLNKKELYNVFNSIKHNLISSEFHFKACNLFFPRSKIKENKAKIKKGSTLIALRYWGMFGYKFNDSDNVVEIILDQIKGIEKPSKNKTIYIKKDHRLSKNIQDEIINKLSFIYNIRSYDDILDSYKDYFANYDFSFGLEVIFYNFPSLIVGFKKIYSFDGSFCWFISNLPDSVIKKFKCDIYIGANAELDSLKKAKLSTINYIQEQSNAQLLPFMEDKRFKVSVLKYFGRKLNLFKIKNVFLDK